MKILFSNVMLTATLSSLHEDENYPVENIQHVFLKKIYKSTQNTDTITATWAANQTVDCFYCAFYNATAIQARFYNSSNTLLQTVNLTASDPGISFASLTTVRKIEIDLTSAGGTLAYLGAAGAGAAYTMPSPIADMGNGCTDNSTEEISPDGQVSMNKIPPLRRMELKFIVSNPATYEAIKALIEARSRPIFIDLYSAAHATYLPMYGIIPGGIQSPLTVGNVTTFSMTIMEAR
jgi:hypothetical protein